MPTGKVKWFDVEKGFGFIDNDEGGEAFLHASALPAEVVNPRKGTRVEFSIVDGRRGPSAMSVRVLDPAPSLSDARRTPPEDMTVIVEDLIKMLDGVSTGLRRGRYPEPAKAEKVAAVLRAVASQLDS